MVKDTLFLLAPGFIGNAPREYCPECAELWGLLNYFPAIQGTLEILYQPIERPREQMLELLGAENQNCPTLLLDETSPIFADCGIINIKSHRFINNARDIGRYYAQRFGTPNPR